MSTWYQFSTWGVLVYFGVTFRTRRSFDDKRRARALLEAFLANTYDGSSIADIVNAAASSDAMRGVPLDKRCHGAGGKCCVVTYLEDTIQSSQPAHLTAVDLVCNICHGVMLPCTSHGTACCVAMQDAILHEIALRIDEKVRLSQTVTAKNFVHMEGGSRKRRIGEVYKDLVR